MNSRPPLDCFDDDDGTCVWVLPKGTLIWAETHHELEHRNGHKVPFTVEQDTPIRGHPNMLRYVGAIQPKPPSSRSYSPQAESGEKPQQAVTPSPTDDEDGGGGQ